MILKNKTWQPIDFSLSLPNVDHLHNSNIVHKLTHNIPYKHITTNTHSIRTGIYQMHPTTEPPTEPATSAAIATAQPPLQPKTDDSSRLSGSEFKSSLSGGLISSSSLSIGGGSTTQIPTHASLATSANTNESPTPTQHQRRLTISVPPALSQTARGW